MDKYVVKDDKVTKIRSYDKIKDDLDNYIEYIESDNKEMKDELSKFDKDTEIQKLNQEIEDTRKHSLQILSDSEMNAVNIFRQEHYKTCKNGNKFIYTLTGTGIGTIIEIKCPICGKNLDVTDTETW